MTLNDLLKVKGIDLKQVIVMRHRPRERALRRVLPWLAAERPELFNAYQQTQGERVERAMQKVKYVASFIGRSPSEATFVGLYSVNGHTQMTVAECEQKPAMAELIQLGLTGATGDPTGKAILWFNLNPVSDFYPEWKGRLIIHWPPPELCKRPVAGVTGGRFPFAGRHPLAYASRHGRRHPDPERHRAGRPRGRR